MAFCGVVFCASTSFAQLSANPWVEANTKEQVDAMLEKLSKEEKELLKTKKRK